MKKKLALLLVLALIVSMVPMSVFAASKNTVSKVIKVKDDADLNGADVPYLKIKNDSTDFQAGERFRLKLETADWLDKGDEVTVTDSAYVENKEIANFADFMAEQIANRFVQGKEGTALAQKDVVVKRISDSTIELTVNKADFVKDDEIRVPLFVAMDGKGDAKVTVETMDSNVSGGTYTFAIGAGGDTVTTIDSVESFADVCDVKTIQIDEAAVQAMGDSTNSRIKLKLPTNFKWIKQNPTVEFSGGLEGAEVVDGKYNFEDRTLEFYVNLSAAADRNTRGSIFVSGLQIESEKNAKTGDVTMTISGNDVTTEDIVIAKYVDYDVTVEAQDEPEELVSGRYEIAIADKKIDSVDDDHELVKLKIEEEVANSWISSRKTNIEFPSWVKIVKVEVSDSDNLADGEKGKIEDIEVGDDNEFEFTAAKADVNDTAMIEFKFYVSIEAGREGDIVAKVGGNALTEDQEVVLGKAVAPVKVDVKPVDIRTGIKNQSLDNIVITEGKAEAVKKGELILRLEEGLKWTDVPEIEVTEGNIDLDIDVAKIGGDKDRDLIIKVKGDSSKASTIEIKNGKVDLTRYVAEGDVELKVTGDAVVENSSELNGKDLDLGAFKEENAAKLVVAKVITPADGNTGAGKEVEFVIGESKFKVDGEEKTMDTAPYIKDGRTMLPVRYVAEALGVSEDNIIWNNATRTVTIFKGNRTVFISIGSAELKVNGTPLYMDTVAEIKDDRTMLPISFVGKALGAQVDWDDATRTVTIK
jgi:hypothetical protein